MTIFLKPSAGLLCKLASIAVHVEEGRSEHGHELDWTAVDSLLSDPEVRSWIDQMSAASLAPRKRNP